MESVASSSSPPNNYNSNDVRLCRGGRPTQPIADRITRALRHPLGLLHRINSKFYVLGATGNVYTVTLSTTPSCTCPDRVTPCKHILFTFLRVLGVSLNDVCIRRRTLRPCQLHHLLSVPTSPDALAGPSVRARFHHLYSNYYSRNLHPTPPNSLSIDVDGAVCPVCLEEMTQSQPNKKRDERVVACRTCRNPIHERCMSMWKKQQQRSCRRRSASCVICRARWSSAAHQQEAYLNLAACTTTLNADTT